MPSSVPFPSIIRRLSVQLGIDQSVIEQAIRSIIAESGQFDPDRDMQRLRRALLGS